MLKKAFNGVEVELAKGDIARQNDMTAVVNAANARLEMGGGVAGALHMAAGPGLAEECRPMAPIKPGEAVISGGHNLPNKYVIHCLGPIYGRDEPADKLLADCYCNALKLADEHKIDAIAFPAISTGAFGFPLKEAARIALQVIRDQAPQLEYVKKIRLVLYSQSDYEAYEELMG
ncbi:MAG: macro domain-containing protein [Desulfobacterales bacterium]|nr:macro domain-containing protein [Desulfobacterales bacterium]